MTQKKSYDIAVIGSGPGGYVAAITAAQQGKKVCLIEKNSIGGTCLNVGCIPTKSLLATANTLEKAKTASELGININDISIDFTKIQKRKDNVVKNLKNSLESLIKANKVVIHKGKANFISPYQLNVEGDENLIIDAKNIIIASGSKPLEISKFPCDNKLIHDSTSILSLEKLPKTIAIVGGGYIGCEFASLFNALGVKVTIIEACPSIIANQEDEIISALSRNFKNKGIETFTSTKLISIDKTSNGVTLHLENGEKISTDICLLSIGRSLNTEELKLENADIETGKNSAIIVNEKMQTSAKHIYAIGDVTGKWMLAHVASHEGIVAANNATGNEKVMRYDAVPSVIFTIPEVASVGLTKKEAIKQGYDISTSSFPLSYLGKAQAVNEKEGFSLLITDNKTNQIIGAHVFGKDASTLIGEMSVAIANELTIKCITDTIHAHPTMSEAWLETALLAEKTPIHHPPIK